MDNNYIFVSQNWYSLSIKRVRPIFNGPSIGLFGATLMGVWCHSFCPSHHPQNGAFTTVKHKTFYNSADSCTLGMNSYMHFVIGGNFSLQLISPSTSGLTL